MLAEFQLFRITLLPQTQGSLFETKDATREQWIAEIFKSHFTFEHHGSTLHFVPSIIDDADRILAGRVGRLIERREHRPPEEDLEELVREGWMAASIIVDPTDHEDGQKLAIEIIKEVASPIAIARSLAKYISHLTDAPYICEINSVLDPTSFWDFNKENEGNITNIYFDLVAPNIFGSDDKFREEMESFRDEERARHVRVELVNRDGLDTDTERVKQAVRYAAQRGGVIRARARGRRKYNSKNAYKKESIETEDLENKSITEKLSEIASRLFRDE